ncbi:MAG: hypothetical protein RR595_02750 [Lysinibacillus sp.]
MTKEKLKGLVALGSVLTAIGFILLLFSVDLGLTLAENWLVRRGGMDTSIYLIGVEGYTNKILAAGSILFGLGISTLIFVYYKILTINE